MNIDSLKDLSENSTQFDLTLEHALSRTEFAEIATTMTNQLHNQNELNWMMYKKNISKID